MDTSSRWLRTDGDDSWKQAEGGGGSLDAARAPVGQPCTNFAKELINSGITELQDISKNHTTTFKGGYDLSKSWVLNNPCYSQVNLFYLNEENDTLTLNETNKWKTIEGEQNVSVEGRYT